MTASKILITGDSLSFNRYTYIETHELNSFSCPANMLSWSYKLRNHVISTTKNFTYGQDLKISKLKLEDTVFDSLAYNGNESCAFYYPYKTSTITLYLQKHQDGGVYNVDIDNGFDTKKIDFKGNPDYFRSREVFLITLNANENLNCHHIKFTGSGVFTLLGISTESKEVIISGKGSQKTEFFIDNYDDYISKYDFDLAIIILGANDLGLKTPIKEFEEKYSQLLQKITLKTKNIILLTPTNIISNESLKRLNLPKTDDSYKYVSVIKKLAKNYNAKYLDTYSIFENISTDIWRCDNVHLSRIGNDVLYKKVIKLIK